MRLLIAPDSFKGTYTAGDVAACIAAGARAGGATAVELPVADGGEGTAEILAAALGARRVAVQTLGPWRDPLTAEYSLGSDGTAIIGLAAASGLTLSTAGLRDPLSADTYGTGILMSDAVARGARHIVVAAGGSATTDGGTGAVRAIEERGGLRGAAVTVLSDVTTVFEDAARVFGPQKGATPEQVAVLTERLHRQAAGFPRDPRGVPATGAAGGFSGGLWAHFGAELLPGADYMLDALGFDRLVAEADAVVVGEGRLDSQTGQGKIISAILARSCGVPVYAVVGSVGDDLGEYSSNFAEVVVASDAVALEAAGRRIANAQAADPSPTQPFAAAPGSNRLDFSC